MKEEQKIMRDKVYIPELLKRIDDDNLKQRLEHELYTYSTRALFYKIMYYVCTGITILFPALVTVINVCTPGSESISISKIAVTSLSALSSVVAGFLGVSNAQDNWIAYRENCELLKQEIFMYLEKNGDYKDIASDEERKDIFINKVMLLYNEERSSWKKINQDDD